MAVRFINVVVNKLIVQETISFVKTKTGRFNMLETFLVIIIIHLPLSVVFIYCIFFLVFYLCV